MLKTTIRAGATDGMRGPAGEETTLVERAVARIRHDIVAGAYAPDARLGINDMVERYGIGATPIREALSRLTAAGLVHAVGNRGFRVPAMSRHDLEDITRLRQLVECEALRESIARGDDEWEAGVVAALHRLRNAAAASGPGEDADVTAIDRTHKRFHTSLIAACGSQRMLDLHDRLYDQAFRYRSVMVRGLAHPRSFPEVHVALAEVVLKRNPARACAALSQHLALTVPAVYGDGDGR